MRYVEVRLLSQNNNLDLTVTANYNGVYRFDNVPVGTDYILMPVRAGVGFAPETRTFNLQGETLDFNFTAQ